MTTTAAGLFLWEIVVEHQVETRIKRSRIRITHETKCTGGAHKKAVEYLAMHGSTYERPFIRQVIYKGVISA